MVTLYTHFPVFVWKWSAKLVEGAGRGGECSYGTLGSKGFFLLFYNYYSNTWNRNQVTKIMYILFIKKRPLIKKTLPFYAFVRLPGWPHKASETCCCKIQWTDTCNIHSVVLLGSYNRYWFDKHNTMMVPRLRKQQQRNTSSLGYWSTAPTRIFHISHCKGAFLSWEHVTVLRGDGIPNRCSNAVIAQFTV